MFGNVTALEELHVTGKYRDRSMQHPCSRYTAWDPHNEDLSPGLGCMNLQWKGSALQHVHLTQCIYLLVEESQRYHKTVNFIFKMVSENNKLTILWGS